MRISAVAVAIFTAGSLAVLGAPGLTAPLLPAQQFDDRPERLIPAHPRTEFDEDRLEAAAMFASGRMLEKPKDFGIDDAAKLTLLGKDGLTYELIATTYLEVNRPDSAAAAFARLNEVAPSKADAALNAARVAAKAKHPDKALAKLQEYFD